MSSFVSSSNHSKISLVIIGNGMATGRLLDEIIKRDEHKYKITVIGDEKQGSYNRIMLSSVLAKETKYKNIIQKPPQWYKDNDVNFIPGYLVTHINKDNKILTLNDPQNTEITYDELVIATGSRPAAIPAKNQNIKGLYNFRTINDTKNIEAFSKHNNHAAVIGGGLLGLEAAYGLASNGTKVTLIHRNKWLLNRQLDKTAGDLLQKVMAEKNIDFVLGEEVVRFDQLMDDQLQASVSGVELTSGAYIKANMVVIATGITPNAEIGLNAGLTVNRAIVVDDYMLTSDPSISAIGECCEHNKLTFGLVDPIWKQCESLAIRFTESEPKVFENPSVATKLKVSGVQLFSAGVVESSEDTQTFHILDENARVYRKLILKDEMIVGIVLFGDVNSGMHYFESMQNKTPVKNQLPELLLGSEFITPAETFPNECAA